MLTPQYLLPIHSELVVDLFAGGGGASSGIEQAIGRPVDVAINHNAEAISLHTVNHPQTRHYCSDVFEVDPVEATQGRKVGLLWASPACTHFSKARGGKPVKKQERSLAWVVVKWAKAVRPRVIFLENVEEFVHWTNVTADQKPCPQSKGKTFALWVESLRSLGYKVEWRELRACDFGAPTIRKRLFVVARCDGQPIIWPQPTHGDPKKIKKTKLKPWRAAAECIDWSIPCPSIFNRKKPLADNTLRRIAKGIVRYVLKNPVPFIISANHTADYYQYFRGQEISAPLGTVTTTPGYALVSAFLAKHYGGIVGSDLHHPLGTVTTVDHHSLVTASLSSLYGTNQSSRSLDAPLPTVTTCGGGNQAHVAALLVKYYGNERGGVSLTDPMHTITTKDRLGLVTVLIEGEPYVITDIGMRMLQPRELFAAQGFPASYCITTGADGKPLGKKVQTKLCGNSVCPPVAKAIITANYLEQQRIAA